MSVSPALVTLTISSVQFPLHNLRIAVGDLDLEPQSRNRRPERPRDIGERVEEAYIDDPCYTGEEQKEE